MVLSPVVFLYRTLELKEAETLTNDEYSTLIQLSNTTEQFGAQRLEALANLAQLPENLYTYTENYS